MFVINIDITDMVSFHWGFCPRGVPIEKYIYEIGDSIYWKPCKDGSIRSWFAFSDGTANIGDPSIQNIILRDVAHYYEHECKTCLQPIGGAVVEIRNGIIINARLYRPGEFDDNTDFYIIQDNGMLKPMPEWIYHELTGSKDCEIFPL